jgi:D-alanine-D-alanine ligase-like ATP-grasp enzyme
MGVLFLLYNECMNNCEYCGNHPVSHTAHRLFDSADIMLGPLRKRLFFGWFGRNILDPISTNLGMSIFYLLKALNLIKINKDIDQISFDRARSLWLEAKKRGIDIAEIKPFGLPIDLYQAPIGGKPTLFFGLPRPHTIDESILDWVDDKWIMKQKLKASGVKVAEGKSFRTLSPALEFFHRLKRPAVVKPRKGSRNRHTTVLVQNEEQLTRAFKVAKQLCSYVIVEEYLYGDLFRGTVINGNLVGIFGLAPAKVTGNGQDTIGQLIESYNKNLPRERTPVQITQRNIRHLMLQNLNLDSVLPKEHTVPLSDKFGPPYGGISYDSTDQAHHEVHEMMISAARAVGDPILGFDFITDDITKPLSEQRIGIIECNGAPFINLHDDPLIGQPRNAAKYVWDLVS